MHVSLAVWLAGCLHARTVTTTIYSALETSRDVNEPMGNHWTIWRSQFVPEQRFIRVGYALTTTAICDVRRRVVADVEQHQNFCPGW